MIRTPWLLLTCLVALVGCNQEEEPKAAAKPLCSEERLAGGWAQVEVTPEVGAALEFVLSQMNTATKLKNILSVRSQVVNGMNYAIEFELDNGEVWNTTVYRSLNGEMTMTQQAQQGRICP